MRKTLAAVLVASTMLIAGSALASDPPPPPPPPPDSGDTSSSSSSGASLTHQPGGLFDTASGKQRPMLLSVFAGLPYAYYGYGFGFGIGARFYLPLVQDGFIPQINDEFGLEFGVDIAPSFGTFSYFFFDIPVQVVLDVHVTPQFDAYVKLGICPTLYFGHDSGFYAGSLFAGAVGLKYKLGEKFYLRAEAGYPMVMVGIGFGF